MRRTLLPVLISCLIGCLLQSTISMDNRTASRDGVAVPCAHSASTGSIDLCKEDAAIDAFRAEHSTKVPLFGLGALGDRLLFAVDVVPEALGLGRRSTSENREGPAAQATLSIQHHARLSPSTTVPSPGPGSVHIDRDPACNPIAIGNDCFLPYPSSYYTRPDPTSPTGVQLAYDKATFHSPFNRFPMDLALLDFADGASPLTQILVNFGVDVAPSQLWGHREAQRSFATNAPVAVLDEETGERFPIMVEMDQTGRSKDHAGRWAMIVRPLAPLAFGHRYMVVITDDLEAADGSSLPRSEAFDALRSGTPTDDAAVEALRPRYQDLFSIAEKQGFPRDRLLLAWEFQVASERSVLEPIRSMRDQTLASIRDDGIRYKIKAVIRNPRPNVGWLVRGTFTPPGFLKHDKLLRDDQDEVERQHDKAYPFTMIIPPIAETQGNLALVVSGHGSWGSGDSYLTTDWVSQWASYLSGTLGVVMIATDWIGMSESDRDLPRQVAWDPSRLRVIPVRLAQAIVNNLALTELAVGPLQDDPAIGRANPTRLVDPDKVYYWGSSLGGSEGTALVAVSPRISRALLADAGGAWTQMLTRSYDYQKIQELLDLRYSDPLTQTLFITALQGFFDVSDPATVGQLMAGDPDLPDAPKREVVFQYGLGDCRLPNIGTEILMRAVGAHQLEYAPDPIYGLDLVDASAPVSPVVTQYVLPNLLVGYMPPDGTNAPARKNNHVHITTPTAVAAYHQAFALLKNGKIIHPCKGICDPD